MASPGYVFKGRACCMPMHTCAAIRDHILSMRNELHIQYHNKRLPVGGEHQGSKENISNGLSCLVAWASVTGIQSSLQRRRTKATTPPPVKCPNGWVTSLLFRNEREKSNGSDLEMFMLDFRMHPPHPPLIPSHPPHATYPCIWVCGNGAAQVHMGTRSQIKNNIKK